jgi:hypothetical protein
MTVSRLRRCAPALVVVALAAALSGCSSTMSDAATIEYPSGSGAQTMHVELANFEKELGELTANKAFREYLESQEIKVTKDNADSVFATVWLSDLITQAAVDREFDALGLKLSENDVNKAVREIESPSNADTPLLAPSRIPPDIYKTLSKSYRTTLAERRARGDKVYEYWKNAGEAQARPWFEQNKELFRCKAVSHVLVKTEAEAKQILADLEAGKDFAEIARAKSTDPGSGPQGGQLGCLQPGAFVEEFQSEAEAAPLDTPVGPVKSQFGYHVIKVQQQDPTYEDIAERLLPALQRGEAVKQAVSAGKVEVNPRFGSPGGAVPDQQTGVVSYRLRPPVAPSVLNGRDATTTTTVPFIG